MPDSERKALPLSKKLFAVLCHILVFPVLGALPIPWHEIVGHGPAGVLCSGTITKFRVFGLQFLPDSSEY